MSTAIFSEMSTTGHFPMPEPSESDLRHGLFTQLDKRAREIEAQTKSAWIELADICQSMQDSEYWREGGFSSYNSWLLSACPTSRSWAYTAVKLREELRDVPTEELKQMPVGNAAILARLPKAVRASEKVRTAAKSKPPREFVSDAIAASPDSHLEKSGLFKVKATISQLKIYQAFFEMYRLLYCDHGSEAEMLEEVLVEWMQSRQEQYQEATANA